MKSNNSLIVIFLLILSLTFNFYQGYEMNKLKDQSNIYKNSSYIIATRLGIQRWVYERISGDLQKIKDGEKTLDELSDYLDGVREFTHPDATSPIFGGMFYDNQDVLRVLNRVLGSANLSKSTLEKVTNNELEKLIEVYTKLGYLLDPSRKENSLIYFIENNELDNIKFIEIIDEIDLLIDEIN